MTYTDYIWDLGGTLLDNYHTSSAAFSAVLRDDFGVNVADEAVYAALRVSTEFAVSEFAADLPDFIERYKKREAKSLRTPILFPDAQAVLAEIVHKGHRNFMISHRNKQVLAILEAANIAKYFTEVVTSDNGFARKPSPESIQYLMAKYHPESPVMIGDRVIDIQAGQNAGIDTIFFMPDDTVTNLATHEADQLKAVLTF